MSVALIIKRIGESVAAGNLAQKPDYVFADQQLTMADLLRDWGEVFPGQIYNPTRGVNLFHRGQLRNPQIAPQIRRSSKPLRAPKLQQAPAKQISPCLFESIQAINDWYRQQGVPECDLAALDLNQKNLEKFLDELYERSSDFYPLSTPIECLSWDGCLVNLSHIHLMLPHWFYDQECAGAVEAFLTGPSGVEWLMNSYYGYEGFLSLPEEDRRLIDEVGFGPLAEQYAQPGAGRSYDLNKLENHQSVFFSEVWYAFPEQKDNPDLDPPIISVECGSDVEIPITEASDIDFCIAYAKAFFRMLDDMPDPEEIEGNDFGVTDTFAHELCEVWRMDKGLPLVAWTSPAAMRERIRV